MHISYGDTVHGYSLVLVPFELEKHLGAYHLCCRDTWIRIGYAIHTYRIRDTGIHLIHQFSKNMDTGIRLYVDITYINYKKYEKNKESSRSKA